ncbi:MAG: protease modulator HflC [Ferrovum sp. 37-45-19]|nr:modulator of FtsH protease HflC [Ferrovum sp. JA12]OYV80166.1 MAG: protease modulator HflC [Ferrovum sp. 21-44-67]OYV94537.1 MAG: protease modulator HflC [Ferrovum sp. 37-45-19]OZB32426.1 MAG: protease modulator HflC [Ferrovum sp. 34-44-207]
MKNLSIYVATLVLLLIIGSMGVFVISQTQNALVFELGKIVAVDTQPGLYLKMPFIENVRLFDTRIQTLDNNEPQRFITSEKKPLLVDYFVKWQITDVKQYYVSVGGDSKRAEIRLAQTVNDELRAEFAKRTVHEAVSGERESIMANMRARTDQDAKEIGIRVLDVRIRRVELTPEVSDSVYRRMQAERKRVANELRSTGAGEAEKIRADANREREVILADAFRQAQEIKGKGDAKAAAIYAEAYKRNPEFYAFYRSLQTYQEGLNNKSDILVLDPNSPFFKYLKPPPGSLGGK